MRRLTRVMRLRDREFSPADRSIDVRISRLRHVLRDNARRPSIIKMIHARGYAIGVAVEDARRSIAAIGDSPS